MNGYDLNAGSTRLAARAYLGHRVGKGTGAARGIKVSIQPYLYHHSR